MIQKNFLSLMHKKMKTEKALVLASQFLNEPLNSIMGKLKRKIFRAQDAYSRSLYQREISKESGVVTYNTKIDFCFIDFK